MSFWQKISNTGVSSTASSELNRTIILCNRVSLLLSCFIFILGILSFAHFGFIASTKVALLFSLFTLLPIVLNEFGHINSSRTFLSVAISIACVVGSILDKFDYRQIEELQFYLFRFLLLSATIFPFILFNLKEYRLWVSATTINFLCIVLYDPIHHYLGIGYYQLGLSGPSYYFINFIVLAAFAVISSSTYFLKYSFEKYEAENIKLINQLSSKQKELLDANKVIDEQRDLLAQENERLNSDLLQKNEQLSATNSELIVHNNNLEQFSYTISHNLRGPLASLQGLANIVNQDQLGEENKPLFGHFLKSVNALDTTIKDLSHIIEIRNNVASVKDLVNLHSEVQHIKELLQKEITDHQVVITCEFKVVELNTIKAMLHSILYNLISNAIKYRSYERNLIINIRSHPVGDSIQLEVQDNGLGIDLSQHKDKLFGLYKRFHTHTEGKGLGLFLVKLQAESLGGHVAVLSKPGIGTTFTIVVKGNE